MAPIQRRCQTFLAVAVALVGVLALRHPCLAGGQIAIPQNRQSRQDGTLAGRIVLRDGSPLAGVRVGALALPANPAETSAVPPNLTGPGARGRAASADLMLMSLSQTDAAGRFRLEGVAAGRYYLVAGPLDAPVYFPGVTDVAKAAIVTMGAGAALDGLDFQLAAPLTLKVSGRVIREGGHKAGTQMVLMGGPLPVSSAAIAADGSFEFPAVRPGTYQLRVNPTLRTLPPLTVVVADKDVTELQIAIPLSAVTDVTVNFTVVLEGGGLLPRVQLRFIPNGPVPANVPANGRTVLVMGSASSQQLPVGEYTVSLANANGLANLPAGYKVKSIAAGPLDLLQRSLKLTPLDSPQIAVTLSVSSPLPWVKVSGRITGLATSSVKADSITINGGVLASPLTAVVTADGSFEFPMVLPGSYRAQLMPSADPFPRTLIVGSTDLANVEIPMALPVLKITGRVTDIAMLGALGQGDWREMSLAPQSRGPGDPPFFSELADDGAFAFNAVQPGTYVLTIFTCHSDLCMGSAGGLVTVTVVDRDITDMLVSASGR